MRELPTLTKLSTQSKPARERKERVCQSCELLLMRLLEYIWWAQKYSCTICSCFKTQRLRRNFWFWFTNICTSWILLGLVGYWFKDFLNSDSAQQRKLKALGGEPAAWTMSNKPPDSKQPHMGLSNYQAHLPLPCKTTRKPGWSSECRSVAELGALCPTLSSCICKCNSSRNRWLGKSGDSYLDHVLAVG